MKACSGFLHHSAGHCRRGKKTIKNPKFGLYFASLQDANVEEGAAALKATDVFVGFLLLDQLREATLHNAGCPLVDQSLAVVVIPNNTLDALTHARKHKKPNTVMWESPVAVSPRRK